MSELPHLDCTTEERREEICTQYNITADDCIVLYGGRIVRSDANNRIIADRYYQFSCVSRDDKDDKYVILCGAGAARHLCQLIGQPMPPAFNPFVEVGGEGHGGGEGVEREEGVQ